MRISSHVPVWILSGRVGDVFYFDRVGIFKYAFTSSVDGFRCGESNSNLIRMKGVVKCSSMNLWDLPVRSWHVSMLGTAAGWR